MRFSRTRLSSGIMHLAHGTPWRSQRQGIGYSDTHCGSCTASALRSASRPVGSRACLRLDDPEPSPCTRRLARPFTFACDASGISGPRFGVIGFATPVSLLPSVIPPHLRSLPSTGIAPLPRYSEPLRHPASPRPDPARSPVPCVHTPDRASRVAAVPLFHACPRHYPGGTVGAPVARFPTCASLPRVIAGSASASLFSRPARRSLSLPPACSLSRLATLFHRSASAQVVTSPSRSDRSRLERQLPDGVRTRWVTAPFHGARLRSANPTYVTPRGTAWKVNETAPKTKAPC